MRFLDVVLNPDDTIVAIDEAGRGPVLGPMVLACCFIKASDIPFLENVGVKDSKKLSDKQRGEMFREFKKEITWDIQVIQPDEIDTCPNGLNIMEMEHAALFVKKYNPTYFIMDSPFNPKAEFNISSFMYEHTGNKTTKYFAENKADDIYPAVSAASIVAKEARERSMQQLREYFGVDFGSGYPADPKTKQFMSENWKDHKYNNLIRKSWETYKRLKEPV